jgi:hypothetical protein
VRTLKCVCKPPARAKDLHKETAVGFFCKNELFHVSYRIKLGLFCIKCFDVNVSSQVRTLECVFKPAVFAKDLLEWKQLKGFAPMSQCVYIAFLSWPRIKKKLGTCERYRKGFVSV